MSDYKRLVAYIYLYDKGNRVKNIGFTKAEAKNGQLRIQVHIKGAWIAEGDLCEAYLFYRKKRQLKGVYIGEFFVTNGSGEWKVATDSGNVMESGVGFLDMSGIIMRTAGGKYFATRWDDEPMDPEQFDPYETEEEKQIGTEPEIRSEETWNAVEVQALEAVPEKGGQGFFMLDPADLLQYGELGRRLVNNSFLLHGYYSYGHLLRGQDDKDDFLGVPGEFCMQEKMMASLFGFPEFRTLDSFKRNTGNTGYWLRRFEYGSAGKIHESGHRAGQEGI